MSPASSVYATGGSAITLPTATLAGSTFSGWYTAVTGGTLVGLGGALYTPTQSVTLYAQWSAASASSVVISFDANGGTGTEAPLNGTTGSAIVLPDTSAYTYNGYTLTSWNTAANGSGTVYALGQSVTFSASVTLYAQWTADSSSAAVVTISLNEGNGTILFLSGTEGQAMGLPSASSVTNPGYTLAAWTTVATGGGTSYAPGSNVLLVTSMTLYAQWTPVGSVQLSFSANGGTGIPTTLSGAPGAMVSLPGSSALARTGYAMTSWNSAANGSGTSYALGQSVILSTSMTLYAQWKVQVTSVLYGAVGDFARNSTKLSAGMRGQVDRLALVIKKKKYNKVTLFGYTAEAGLASIDRSLSTGRALHVAAFLRQRLKQLKVKGVTVLSAGEGAVGKNTSSLYSRVEVFVV